MDELFPLSPLLGLLIVVFGVKALLEAVLDSRVHHKLIGSNPSDELVRTLLVEKKKLRRQDSLRWGLILFCVAVGLGIIERAGWETLTPGGFAILLGATGVGHLLFFVADRVVTWLDGPAPRA
jgi:hypothetical protein